MKAEFYSIRDVADKLRLSPRTIHRMLNAQKLPWRTFGGVRRIVAEDVDAMVEAEKNAAHEVQREHWKAVARAG